MKPPSAMRASSTEMLVAEVTDDFLERLHRGERPQIEDYAERYPEIASLVRQVFPALQVVRAITPDATLTGDQSRTALAGRLGDYRIIREVGRGGMGVVYEAEQVSLGRKVALKVLPFAAVLDERQLQRFKNEAQAAAQLHHTNIVPVFSVGCERGVHYYAMQYIEGSTLAEVIHELRQLTDPEAAQEERPPSRASELATDLTSGRLAAQNGSSTEARLGENAPTKDGSSAALEAIAPELSTRSPAFFRSVANLGVQAAEALEHAHELGVVHRDIKPSNLLLDTRGNLWITDFGLARLESDPGLTMTGDVLGTVRYMSPEQALGKHLLLDHRTDIYSLGVTLYELLTLRPALDGRDRQELLRKVADEDPRLPRRLNSAIPADLETIVLKATAKEPERRYATAKEMAADLGRFLGDKPIQAKRPTLAQRAAKWSRRHRAVVASGVVLLVMAVIALSVSTILIWQEQARTEEARDQLETVTKFQASMLSEIDAELMGRRIIDDLRQNIRERMQSEGTSAGQIEAALASFDELAAKVNATGIALKVMDENVLARAVETIEKDLANQPLIEAALHQTVGDTYQKLGLYVQAMPHTQRALALRREVLGDDHADTLTSINNMGALLQQMGKLEEALPYHREALEARRRVLGDDHPDTLGSINDMGALLKSMGKPEEALPYFREALDGFRRVLGDDHPDTLGSINNMGVLLNSMGEFEEALPYYHEALEASRRVLGDDHRITLFSSSNMGALLSKMGEFEEALPYYHEALETRRRVLGDDHPDTLSSIRDMGALLRQMGKLEEALPYHREALDGFRRVLGDDHPTTLDWIASTGFLLMSMGKLEEALPYNREALEAARRVLGDDHPRTLTYINNTGSLLRSMGKLEEALPYYRESLDAHRRVLGDDHQNTLILVHTTGTLLREMGKLEEALPYHREALDARRRVLGDDHPETLTSISDMGALLKSMGKLEEALPYFREALEGFRRVRGDDHQYTLAAISNMGALLREMGKLEEALPYQREALEGFRRVLGDDHPDTLISLSNLGDLLREMGKLNEAEALAGQAVAAARRSLPEGHWKMGVFLLRQGQCLAALRRYVDSETALLEAHEILEAALGAKHPRTVATIEALAGLYDDWHAAEPEEDYDAKAAAWRSKLNNVNQPGPAAP
jgi:serine/threonine protein kinase/Tfp pilus assembly protein PilF